MPDMSVDRYEDALRREIMASELQRMRALAAILLFLLALTSFIANFLTEFTRRIFEEGLAPWMPLAAIGPFVVYEFGTVALLRWRMARDLDFPRPARFANALVETSLPSVLIFLLAGRMEPQLVFGFWPPLLYFIFVLLSTLRLDFWLSLWTGVVAAVQLYALAAHYHDLNFLTGEANQSPFYHLSRSAVLLMAGIVAGLVAVRLRRQFENSAAAAATRDRVTSLFGQHVSPAVVERLLAQASDPPSEMRTVCVLFLDIRGFTAMTRVRAPDATVRLLNEFFAAMVAVVDRHHGIVNKFLGDGFLALFGAPLPDPQAASHALAAAQAMVVAVEDWNRANPERPLRIGIGIHVGEVVAGDPVDARATSLTAVGDTVNTASRIEALNKEFGSQLVISEAVAGYATIELPGIEVHEIAVRGRVEQLRVLALADARALPPAEASPKEKRRRRSRAASPPQA